DHRDRPSQGRTSPIRRPWIPFRPMDNATPPTRPVVRRSQRLGARNAARTASRTGRQAPVIGGSHRSPTRRPERRFLRKRSIQMIQADDRPTPIEYDQRAEEFRAEIREWLEANAPK